MDLLQQFKSHSNKSIEQAECLPLAVYHDPQVAQLEQEKIFTDDWLFICSSKELSRAGDYYAFTLSNEPIAIIRGQDQTLRALSNICRHRATPLLDEGFGKVEKNIICPYHAWTYNDQGELKGVPLSGNITVDKADHCLPSFALQEKFGLLFINLSENPSPLEDKLAGLERYLEIFQLDRFKQGIRGKSEQWQANWKLILENAMESYHLFKVHAETLEQTTPTRNAFYLAGNHQWSVTAGKIKGVGDSKFLNWLSGPYPEILHHYLLISIPPSFVGILTYESFDWLQVMPVDNENSLVRAGGMSTDKKGHNRKSAINFVQQFFAEDQEICQRVQRGMKAKRGKGGKLVEMEQVVVDFHQYLADKLFSNADTQFRENKDKYHLFEK